MINESFINLIINTSIQVITIYEIMNFINCWLHVNCWLNVVFDLLLGKFCRWYMVNNLKLRY